MKSSYAPFDAAQYLDNDTVVAEYLTTAAEDPNPDVFLAALGDLAKARGMAQIAEITGLGRKSLYKALAVGAHPRNETVSAILRALGVKQAIVAIRDSGVGAARDDGNPRRGRRPTSPPLRRSASGRRA